MAIATLSLNSLVDLPPPPPPPGGGDFDLDFEFFSDADASPVQALVAPTVIILRALATNSIHPLRTVFPSRDLSVFDGSTPELVYDDAFHKVEYFWQVTRPAGSPGTWNPPGPHGYNMPTAWNNRNRAFGPLVMFCLDTPGEHTITCTARARDGGTASRSITVTAVDPNVAYAGPLTLAVRPVGDTDSSWIPAGAQVFETGATDFDRWAAAMAVMYSSTGLGSNIGRRVLLKPGHSYDFRAFRHENNYTNPARLISLPETTTMRRYYFGVPLGAAQATIRQGEREVIITNRNRRLASITLNGLFCEGVWDALSETVRDGATQHSSFMNGATGTHWNIHKCRIDGHAFMAGTPIDDSRIPENVKFRLLFSECFMTNWASYGIATASNNRGAHGVSYGPSMFGFMGTKFFRDPNAPQGTRLAVSGGAYPEGTNNRYPAARGAGPEFMYMGGCDWSTWTWQQPTMRWYDSYPEFNNQRMPYHRINIDRVVQESEFRIGPASGVSGAITNPGNIVIDRVLIIGNSNTVSEMRTLTGSTVRNCVFVIAVPKYIAPLRPGSTVGTSVQNFFIRINQGDLPNDPRAICYLSQPSEIYNNTVVFLLNSSENVGGGTPIFVDKSNNPIITFEQWNNVIHMPNYGADVGPFTTSLISGVTPRALGDIATIARGQIDLGTSGVAVGATFEFPYALLPNTDISGNALTGPTNRQYWIDNPTHNAHMLYRSGQELDAVSYVGQTAQHRVQLVEYTNTGIVFRNNGPAAMTGIWFLQADRRGLRPPPNPAWRTPTNTLLNYTPAAGNPALGSAVEPIASRNHFGDVQSPRNRGAF